jgi:copper chaperone NosL
VPEPERPTNPVVPRHIRLQAGSPRALLIAFVMGCTLLIAACSDDPGSGPVAVKWDRVACERCRMLVSDRRHSVQARVTTPGGKSKLVFFDDIGCALIWLEDQPQEIRETSSTEIWVTDWRNGHWIDARAATYVTGQTTPMEYGLGAQTESVEGGLDYASARNRVFEVERRFDTHGAHFDGARASGSAQSGR